MSEAKKYSLKREEIDIEVGDDSYILREMTGRQRDEYLNFLGSRMKTGPDGKTSGIKDFSGLESSLLTRCIVDKEGTYVTEKIIQEWPASTVHEMFQDAQRMNGLDEKAEDRAKNE